MQIISGRPRSAQNPFFFYLTTQLILLMEDGQPLLLTTSIRFKWIIDGPERLGSLIEKGCISSSYHISFILSFTGIKKCRERAHYFVNVGHEQRTPITGFPLNVMMLPKTILKYISLEESDDQTPFALASGKGPVSQNSSLTVGCSQSQPLNPGYIQAVSASLLLSADLAKKKWPEPDNATGTPCTKTIMITAPTSSPLVALTETTSPGLCERWTA